MESVLSVLIEILKWVYHRVVPRKTKLASFKQFLDRKIKQASHLTKRKDLSVDHLSDWHSELTRGLLIALGPQIKDDDIKLSCDIIESRIDGLKFYPNSQTNESLKQTIKECVGYIDLIRNDAYPELLSAHFEPADLKTL